MTLRQLEISTSQGRIDVEFSKLTVLTGSPNAGKSSLLKIINKIFENIDKVYQKVKITKKSIIKISIEIPQDKLKIIKRRFSKIWKVDLSDWDGTVQIIYNIDKDTYETIFKIPIVDEPIFQVSYRDGEKTIIKKPIEVEIKDKSVSILDIIKSIRDMPQTHLFSTYEEELEIILGLIESIVTSLKSVKIYRIGPYIDYSSCIDMRDVWSIYSDDYVGIHGENTLVALSRAFADGRLWPNLAKLLSYLEKIGISRVRCGIVNGKLSITYISDEGLVTCPELSCSIRSLITYYTQLMLAQKNSILMIDNFDYCLNEDTCRVLIPMFKDCLSRNVQIILEVHSRDIVSILTRDAGFREIKIDSRVPTYIKFA